MNKKKVLVVVSLLLIVIALIGLLSFKNIILNQEDGNSKYIITNLSQSISGDASSAFGVGCSVVGRPTLIISEDKVIKVLTDFAGKENQGKIAIGILDNDPAVQMVNGEFGRFRQTENYNKLSSENQRIFRALESEGPEELSVAARSALFTNFLTNSPFVPKSSSNGIWEKLNINGEVNQGTKVIVMTSGDAITDLENEGRALSTLSDSSVVSRLSGDSLEVKLTLINFDYPSPSAEFSRVLEFTFQNPKDAEVYLQNLEKALAGIGYPRGANVGIYISNDGGRIPISPTSLATINLVSGNSPFIKWRFGSNQASKLIEISGQKFTDNGGTNLNLLVDLPEYGSLLQLASEKGVAPSDFEAKPIVTLDQLLPSNQANDAVNKLITIGAVKEDLNPASYRVISYTTTATSETYILQNNNGITILVRIIKSETGSLENEATLNQLNDLEVYLSDDGKTMVTKMPGAVQRISEMKFKTDADRTRFLNVVVDPLARAVANSKIYLVDSLFGNDFVIKDDSLLFDGKNVYFTDLSSTKPFTKEFSASIQQNRVLAALFRFVESNPSLQAINENNMKFILEIKERFKSRIEATQECIGSCNSQNKVIKQSSTSLDQYSRQYLDEKGEEKKIDVTEVKLLDNTGLGAQLGLSSDSQIASSKLQVTSSVKRESNFKTAELQVFSMIDSDSALTRLYLEIKKASKFDDIDIIKVRIPILSERILFRDGGSNIPGAQSTVTGRYFLSNGFIISKANEIGGILEIEFIKDKDQIRAKIKQILEGDKKTRGYIARAQDYEKQLEELNKKDLGSDQSLLDSKVTALKFLNQIKNDIDRLRKIYDELGNEKTPASKYLEESQKIRNLLRDSLHDLDNYVYRIKGYDKEFLDLSYSIKEDLESSPIKFGSSVEEKEINQIQSQDIKKVVIPEDGRMEAGVSSKYIVTLTDGTTYLIKSADDRLIFEVVAAKLARSALQEQATPFITLRSSPIQLNDIESKNKVPIFKRSVTIGENSVWIRWVDTVSPKDVPIEVLTSEQFESELMDAANVQVWLGNFDTYLTGYDDPKTGKRKEWKNLIKDVKDAIDSGAPMPDEFLKIKEFHNIIIQKVTNPDGSIEYHPLPIDFTGIGYPNDEYLHLKEELPGSDVPSTGLYTSLKDAEDPIKGKELIKGIIDEAGPGTSDKTVRNMLKDGSIVDVNIVDRIWQNTKNMLENFERAKDGLSSPLQFEEITDPQLIDSKLKTKLGSQYLSYLSNILEIARLPTITSVQEVPTLDTQENTFKLVINKNFIVWEKTKGPASLSTIEDEFARTDLAFKNGYGPKAILTDTGVLVTQNLGPHLEEKMITKDNWQVFLSDFAYKLGLMQKDKVYHFDLEAPTIGDNDELTFGLKQDNIIFKDQIEVFFIDFGEARISPDTSHLVQERRVLTDALIQYLKRFASPETIKGIIDSNYLRGNPP